VSLELGVTLPNMAFLEGREPLVRVARAAEELGFDSVWVSDHVVLPVETATPYPYSDAGMRAARPMAVADPIVSLGVAAGCTERVRLGTAVLVLPYRNPVLTAKMLASLDVLSGGRLVLGVGAGWLAEEFEVLRAPDFSLRGQIVEEWIALFRACWTEEQPSFAGRNYSFPAVDFRPQPAAHVPILVGGNSPPALRRAGTVADGWIGTSVTPAEARPAVVRVREHAEAAGRDPGELFFTCGYTLDVRDDGREDERHLVGSPEAIATRLRELEAAGLDSVELRLAPTRDSENPSLERALELMERFARDVRPLL
jgi:probable F420-dependent oxidoreductase